MKHIQLQGLQSLLRAAKGSSRSQICLIIAFMVLSSIATIRPGFAVQPSEVLADPTLEKRARSISAELRCLVCQNQSIDESDAPLARDLRLMVRERLVAGDSDRQVIDAVVARYGEFVLLRPPIGLHTLALWLTPILFLLLAIFMVRTMLYRQKHAQLESTDQLPLSPEERQRLDRLLNAQNDGQPKDDNQS